MNPVQWRGSPLTSGPFPQVAILTDETGKIVREIPVRTKADGEDTVFEAIKELETAVKTDVQSA